MSTGGGSLRAHPGFRTATNAALACVLDALAEQASGGRIGVATVVLAADAHLPMRWLRTTGWLKVIAGPVELADLYSCHELLIARAGRNTAAEAAYCGIPAVLLPVTADPCRGGEQASNAAKLAGRPGIFALPRWQDPAALRRTLMRALSYARRVRPVTGCRGNDSAAAFVAGLLTADTRRRLTTAS